MVSVAWSVFLEVCETGSMSAAAERRGYSQSAVSRQIATLEREAGVALLDRRARGVAPTAAGEAFRQHAQRAVDEAARALRAAREAGAGAPPVMAIGATPSAAAGIVPSALRQLRDVLPRWSLQPGLTGDLEVLTASGELDLAVVTDAPPGLTASPRVTAHAIGKDEMWVIVPVDHRHAGSGQRNLAHFSNDTWVEDNQGSASLLRTYAARDGFEPRTDIEAADLVGKTAMVAAGHAVALVPGLLLPSLRTDVVPIRLVDPPVRGIFALTPAGSRAHDTAPFSGVPVDLMIETLTRLIESSSLSGPRRTIP